MILMGSLPTWDILSLLILHQHAQGEPCLTVLVTRSRSLGMVTVFPSLPQTEHSWGSPRDPQENTSLLLP